jgi:hypothetical protein
VQGVLDSIKEARVDPKILKLLQAALLAEQRFFEAKARLEQESGKSLSELRSMTSATVDETEKILDQGDSE